MPDLSEGLWVHVPCGRLRGETARGDQQCPCGPDSGRWPDWDVSEVAQLCVVCARATAGGSTRWSWLACHDCRRVNDTLASTLGRTVLPLGRHSIMNGVVHRVTGADMSSTAAFASAVERLSVGWDELMAWQLREVHRLARSVGLAETVPLADWLGRFPSGPQLSLEALTRLWASPRTSAP